MSSVLRRALVTALSSVLILAMLAVVTGPPAQAAPPGNDNLAGAASTGLDVTTAVDNTEATKETGEVGQPGCSIFVASVWLKFTAPTSITGTVTVETVGPLARDTVLNVWSGPATAPTPGALAPVGCNDDINGSDNFLSRVTFTPTPGTTYYVQAASFNVNHVGAFSVRLARLAGPAPSNDHFDNPVPLDGRSGSVLGDHTLATRSPTEARQYTLWYSWTAPFTGRFRFETGPSPTPGIDTFLSIFEGTTQTNTPVAANDDIDFNAGNYFSRTNLEAVGGQEYRISIGGFNFAGSPRGPFQLFWDVVPVATTTSLSALSSGQTVTLQASVAPPPGNPVPTGSVEFFEGATSKGTVALEAGGATLVLPDVSPGQHGYTAVYVPANAAFLTSVSPETAVTVAPYDTVTELSLTPGALSVQGAVQVSETGGGSPTGSVEIYEGMVLVKTIPMVVGGADFTLSPVGSGNHTYRAAFVPADPTTFAPSQSADRMVAVTSETTSTALTSTVSGQRVTLRATVTPASAGGTLAGTVEFFEGSTSKGSIALTAGVATLVLDGVPPGAHTYRAVFTSTHPDRTGSTSPNRVVTVAKLASRTAIAAPRTAKAGARPSITVTVRVGTARGVGKVKVTLNGRAVKTVTLSSGKAVVRLPALKRGSAKVVATYLGSATAKPSTARKTITVT